MRCQCPSVQGHGQNRTLAAESPLPGTNLFYSRARLDRHSQRRRGEAKCKHKDEISFLPLLSLPLSPNLSVSLYEGRHESVTALKMTDTACWSHGQEREASRCHKTAHNKHTHTQTLRNEIPALMSPSPSGRTFCIWLSCFKLYCLRL